MKSDDSPMLKVEGLTMSYGGDLGGASRRPQSSVETGKERESRSVVAVNNVSFDVADGEFFTLLGPSGSGKTSTLRSVAGLEVPGSGRISVRDRVLSDAEARVWVPPQGRGLGMVFQSYAIWPHMTVFENAAFPLRIRRGSERHAKGEIRAQVYEVLSIMGLDELAERNASNLSGGQQQRLALARAIVTRPPLLLLDEPLSNLDAKLRSSLRLELQRLQKDLGITSVYVTHDQEEALALSTRIAVMNHGTIEQLGAPEDIYQNPASQFVAKFIGTSNLLRSTVLSQGGGVATFESKIGEFVVESQARLGNGSDLLLSIRPEVIELSSAPFASSGPNQFEGDIVLREYLGSAIQYVIAVGSEKLRCRTPPSLRVESGQRVYLRIPSEHVQVL